MLDLRPCISPMDDRSEMGDVNAVAEALRLEVDVVWEAAEMLVDVDLLDFAGDFSAVSSASFSCMRAAT